MAVWKRKGAAARGPTASVLERLEWFDRPEVSPPTSVVPEPERELEREPAAVATPDSARPSQWLLPVPPWEAERRREAPTPVLEREPVQPEPLEPSEPPPAEAPPEPEPSAPQARSIPPVARPRSTRLRTLAVGLLTVAVSAGVILGTSALRSGESDQTVAAKSTRSAAPVPPTRRPSVRPAAHSKPTAHPRSRPRTKTSPNLRPKPEPRAKAKPQTKPQPQRQAKPKPDARPAAKARPGPAARTPTTLPPFAWSPVPGATAYDFQLFLGAKLVYSKRTPTPGITVPQTWSSNGRLVHLGPGHYRWYVWPVIGGQRSDRAIVQATLDLR